MKNPYIIPALIIAAAILGGVWMLKPSVQPPQISIHQAAYRGDYAAVKQHLAAGVNVNASNPLGSTRLREAAYNGQTKVAELLIANGSDVNAKDIYGATPLHRAGGDGDKEVVEEELPGTTPDCRGCL